MNGFVFYCTYRDLGEQFFKLRLVSMAINKAVLKNVRMWERKYPWYPLNKKKDVLAVICIKWNRILMELPTSGRITIGERCMLEIRRLLSEKMGQHIEAYQRELQRRWSKVKRGEVDSIEADCKMVMRLIEVLKFKQLEYGLFIY